MEIGTLAAILGGALALLSPCGALLLPAFFASTSGAGARLAAHMGLFYAGLLVVLVPLGMGASALGRVVNNLFSQHRSTLILVAGILIIVFGIMQIGGWGFRLDKLVPGRAGSAATTTAGVVRAFFLGITSGVAGFCAGPILGAILSMVAFQGEGKLLNGAFLMAAYGVGMILPLVFLVLVWHRTGIRDRARGRTFEIAGRQFHTTSVITGLVLIAVGIVFITTNGLISMPELVDSDIQSTLQQGASSLGSSLPQVGLIVLAAVVALTLWWFWPRGAAADASTESTDSTESTNSANSTNSTNSANSAGATTTETGSTDGTREEQR